MSRFVAIICSFALIILASNVFPFEQKNKSDTAIKTVELAELIRALAWGTDNTILSSFPIIWKDIKFTDFKQNPLSYPVYLGDYAKHGDVVVSVKGEYPKNLEGEPILWSVGKDWKHGNGSAGLIEGGICDLGSNLFGKLMLEEDIVSSLKIEELLKSVGIRSRIVKCIEQPASDGRRIYAIEMPGKKREWLMYGWSCGHGCSLWFTVIKSKAIVDGIECVPYHRRPSPHKGQEAEHP